MKNILLVLAHPDDESFTMGGTVAKYVKAGWKVDLVCATKGEVGQRGPYDESEDIGLLREQELKQAAEVLGISSVTYLGYIDGRLSSVHAGELEEVIYQKMLEHNPAIVMTYDSDGISNHPDHIKMSLSTTFAFHKYAKYILDNETLGSRDPRRYLLRHEEPLKETPEPKLYYACIPDSVVIFLKKKHVIEEESFGKPWLGVPDKVITTVIDVSKYKAKKIEALQKHVTQQADVNRFLSIPNQPLIFQEYFILRYVGKQEIFMGNNDHITNRL